MIYQQVKPDFNPEFWHLVNAAQHITLTTHVSPDDDAIAAILSLYQIISQKQPGKKLQMVITGTPVERFSSFTYFDQIKFATDLVEELGGSDLLIMLDGGQHYRFTTKPEELKQKMPPSTICFDHHASPPDDFTLALVVPSEPSTASLLYQIFASEIELTKTLAESLLLGILGDTGNFAYLKPQQGYIFLIAKELLEKLGTEMQAFQARYRLIPTRVFAIIQELIKNTAFHESADWGNWQSSFVSRAFAETGDYTDNELSDAKGIYIGQYLRTIKGYPWGAAVVPDRDGNCSISVRSLPSGTNARKLMERTKLGGGHDRAGGGTFRPEADEPVCQPEDCLVWLVKWLEENKPN